MVRLTLSFLNTFQATLDSQPITRFRSTNNQGLLVYLTLQAERPIPREVLATLFWPEESDSNARNNLRQSIYQLRKVLGDLESPHAQYLQVTRHTVQFNAESDYALDVNQFLLAIDSGDLETAVALYQGDLLPGFTCDSLQFEDWLRQEREQLHQVALEALFEVTQGHLQSGRFDRAQIDARRQLTLEPWRESAHRQLMRAYALAGDRSSALAQYNTCQDLLWEELGVEPSAETATLYEEIKAGRLGPVASDETLLPPTKTNHNLPASTTPLIGRELELSQISGVLTWDNQRLVTIVGPGGMGKTRLALAVGSELLDNYSDGIYFVDLAPLAQPEEISLAIASALDYQAPDSSQDLFPQLLITLGRQTLLLILDNFEHLLAGAELVNEILQACPHLSILVTSRQRLNLASESRFELGGLDFPDSVTPEDALTYTAVRLFTDNGRRANSQFVLTDDNGADVARICRLVQGMPLGLVLAASWLELLTPAEIAAEIEESLDFLAAELADLPLRQRSMRAVFKRSWDMLTSAEQRVLANLSVFRGGFTREAAEQVAGANLRVLLALVNKSLLQRHADTGRFTMHELLRQFVGYRSRQGNDSDEVSLAHNRYFSQLVEREIHRSLSLFPPYVPRRLAADTDNLHHAWTYSVDQGLTGDVSRMAPWIVALSFSQGIQPGSILAQVIQSLGQHEGSPTHRDLLHLRLIELDVLSGADFFLARRLLLEFVPLLEAQGDPELC